MIFFHTITAIILIDPPLLMNLHVWRIYPNDEYNQDERSDLEFLADIKHLFTKFKRGLKKTVKILFQFKTLINIIHHIHIY